MFFKVTELVFGSQIVKVTLDYMPRMFGDKAENYSLTSFFKALKGFEASVRQQPLNQRKGGLNLYVPPSFLLPFKYRK